MDRYVIPNLRNACRVLCHLAKDNRGLKVIEVARDLGLPQTTALRILHTLESQGFLRKDDRRYFLGPILIHLGQVSLQGLELKTLAMPILEELSRATDETAHVAVATGANSLIVAVVDSPHPLRAASRPGFPAEMHCSSTGKVFLAYRHLDDFRDLLGAGPYPRHTPHTLTTPESLRPDLVATLERGYGLDNEEYHAGVRCLAAPVRGAEGQVVAAIGITAATLRFGKDRIVPIARHVLGAADQLSRDLGYTGRPAPLP